MTCARHQAPSTAGAAQITPTEERRKSGWETKPEPKNKQHTQNNNLTFNGWWQRGGAGLWIAEEHLLVQAAQGVICRVGVLLDKHVTGRYDIHHNHLYCNTVGQKQLQNMQHVISYSSLGFRNKSQVYRTGLASVLTHDVIGREGNVSGGGGAYKLVRSKSLNFFPIKVRALSTCCWVPKNKTRN